MANEEHRGYAHRGSEEERASERAAYEAQYLADNPNDPCWFDGSTGDDVRFVRVGYKPGDKLAFAGVMSLCGVCRAAVESGDEAAILARMNQTEEFTDNPYLDPPQTARLFKERYAGPA